MTPSDGALTTCSHTTVADTPSCCLSSSSSTSTCLVCIGIRLLVLVLKLPQPPRASCRPPVSPIPFAQPLPLCRLSSRRRIPFAACMLAASLLVLGDATVTTAADSSTDKKDVGGGGGSLYFDVLPMLHTTTANAFNSAAPSLPCSPRPSHLQASNLSEPPCCRLPYCCLCRRLHPTPLLLRRSSRTY